MPDRNTTTLVRLAGRTFDPLDEQALQDDDDEPTPQDVPLPWIVQFAETLTGDDIADLRDRYSVRLTEYLGAAAYVESLYAGDADALRDDPRVRAVMRMTSDLKVAPSARRDGDDDEPTAPELMDVLLLDTADASDVAAIQALAPTSAVHAVVDDRSHGGSLRVRLTADSATVQRIAAIDAVRWVEPVPETVDDAPPTHSVRTVGTGEPAGTVGLDVTERLGLAGRGQVIGMLDNGPPDLAHCFFADPDHPEPGPDHRKVVAVFNASGGGPGEHSTFTAGIAAGDDAGAPGTNPFRSLAREARLVCGNRKDVDRSSVLVLLSQAAASGAVIHSNSWHSKPQGSHAPATYDQQSVDVDTFTWRNEEHIVLGSSGNTGEEQGPPGTAKNALCVSASSLDPAGGDVVGDGSAGPTADGRRKPDVTAVGCGVQSAIVATSCGTGPRAQCASSYATPWAAALVALVRQQFVEGRLTSADADRAEAFTPSAALLRATLVNAAAVESAGSGIPTEVRGWGGLNPAAVLGQVLPRLMIDVRHEDGLSTGETFTLPFTTPSEGLLAVTLVWTDPPAAIGSSQCVVNNLTLKVTGPDGNAVVAVDSNPVQPIQGVMTVSAPAVEWTVTVEGNEVNVGAPGQGFALVVSAAVSIDTTAAASMPLIMRLTRPWLPDSRV